MLNQSIGRKLCHNCDAKPVFAAEIDFIDSVRSLILRNLLKTKNCSKIPGYRKGGYRLALWLYGCGFGSTLIY
jgi:hypothetical protein